MNTSFYSDGLVPQTQVVSGFGNDAVEKLIFERQVEQGFSIIFCKLFAQIDDFSNWIIKKTKKKKKKKYLLFKLPFNQFTD